MIAKRANLDSPCPRRAGALAGLLLLCACAAAAQTTVLHLKNGDRIAGVILSEDATSVVLSNAWVSKLAVPLSQIAQREPLPLQGVGAPATNVPPATPATAPVVADRK